MIRILYEEHVRLFAINAFSIVDERLQPTDLVGDSNIWDMYGCSIGERGSIITECPALPHGWFREKNSDICFYFSLCTHLVIVFVLDLLFWSTRLKGCTKSKHTPGLIVGR